MDEFERIFHRYVPIVYRFLLSLCGNDDLAEELTSETFYQAYLHIGQFRGDCKIETWLCQIAKHALYKEQCRAKRHLLGDGSEQHAAEDTFLAALSDKAQALEIHKHLHSLNEPYREVFMLRVFGELTFKEIANICGKTESWAKVTYFRAKNKLIEKVEEKNEN